MKVDYLIVGQGIAGTILDIHLQNKGLHGIVIDSGSKGASHAAAGIINPLTGRRFEQSWMFDELWDYLVPFYNQVNKTFGNVFGTKAIIRAVDPRFLNALDEKRLNENYEKYFRTKTPSVPCRNPYRFVAVNGAQLLINAFLYSYRNQLIVQNRLYQQKFNHGILKHGQHWIYNEIAANYIIFAEGYAAINNPFFPNIFHNRNRGYALRLHLPNTRSDVIVKTKRFLAPLDKDNYWWGSSNVWGEDKLDKDNIHKELLESFKDEYEMHIADSTLLVGDRPVTKDRRPVIGLHNAEPNMYLFNGFGTKGASLTPFWADKLCTFIIDNEPITNELSPYRFQTAKKTS